MRGTRRGLLAAGPEVLGLRLTGRRGLLCAMFARDVWRGSIGGWEIFSRGVQGLLADRRGCTMHADDGCVVDKSGTPWMETAIRDRNYM